MRSVKRSSNATLRRTVWRLGVAAVAAIALGGACELGVGGAFEDSGTLRLYLTDAPLLEQQIDGVYITVSGVEYHRNGQWEQVPDFGEPQTYNLLELTNGERALLGDLTLPAGRYTQIRFLLDIEPEDDADVETAESIGETPGSYLTFEDSDDKSPLFVPSGLQTGYKAQGTFEVPANGTVEVTADFDARRAVVKAGDSGRYLLRPVIRLVVENQAGAITGTVSSSENNGFPHENALVYAYEQGEFEIESELPDDNGDSDGAFANAVTSARVDDEGAYYLGFLAEGDYHLVLACYDDDGSLVDLAGIEDVAVEAGEITTVEDEFVSIDME